MPTLCLALSKHFKSNCCHCSQFRARVSEFSCSCVSFCVSGLQPMLLGKLFSRRHMPYCFVSFQPLLKCFFLSETYPHPPEVITCSSIYSPSISPKFFSLAYFIYYLLLCIYLCLIFSFPHWNVSSMRIVVCSLVHWWISSPTHKAEPIDGAQ